MSEDSGHTPRQTRKSTATDFSLLRILTTEPPSTNTLLAKLSELSISFSRACMRCCAHACSAARMHAGTRGDAASARCLSFCPLDGATDPLGWRGRDVSDTFALRWYDLGNEDGGERISWIYGDSPS